MTPPSQPPTAGATAGTQQQPPAPENPGTDFEVEARTLMAIAACVKGGDVPKNLDGASIRAHCLAVNAAYSKYEGRWLAAAKPFFAQIRPKDLPPRVVYPFGGGDLVTALTVFPDADEFTTISLEAPGDVRLVRNIPKNKLRGALRVVGQNIRKLLGFSYSNTVNLDVGSRSALPGEIVLHLAALVVHGYEPVSLRYFDIRTDGSLQYLTEPELERLPATRASGGPFDNVEIRFRRSGGGESAKVVTLRHLAQDLSNHELGRVPGLKAYLASRGQVSAMTKAASHLLWADDFSEIRDYLLEHVTWMASDSTGLPPRFATAAGFVQEPYGTFEGPAPFGPIEALDGRAFRHLFQESPKKPLPFRFGYGDAHHRAHLVVTRKPGK